ncbi:unnamed protein product [Effrenium voratum]|nr:unnamed protein product [Effrenium voratum]
MPESKEMRAFLPTMTAADAGTSGLLTGSGFYFTWALEAGWNSFSQPSVATTAPYPSPRAWADLYGSAPEFMGLLASPSPRL